MAKGEEKKLERNFFRSIKPYTKLYDIKIEPRLMILSDTTFLPRKGDFQLSFGFSQVDLALYKELTINNITEIKNNIKFIRSSGNTLNVPLICFELKSGNITSDAIRARNHIADGIKSIYPFTYYVFLAENTSKQNDTVYRQGKHFTHFYISPKKFNNKDFDYIKKSIVEPLLNNLCSNELIKKVREN